MMEFADSSEPVLLFAFWTGVAASALVIAIAVAILLLRYRLRAFTRRRAHFLAQWRPFLAVAIDAVPAHLPELPDEDTESFLILWNHLHQSLRGGVTENLNTIAVRLGIPERALEALTHGGTRERLLAIVTLGHLRERRAIMRLADLTDSPNMTLALYAAKALTRIDPAEAAKLLMPRIVEYRDWPPSLVSGVLAEAGPEAMSLALARCLREASAAELPRLSHLLRNIEPVVRSRVVRELHARGGLDTETIAQCLQALALPTDAELATEYGAHPSWQVRVHAATSLGRIGGREHLDVLRRLLTDPQWWVRYRAAQAIVQLSGLTGVSLDGFRDSLADRYARNMLDHVVAEGQHA
ncbi:MAG: HEAT repeat domain-containing protein [Pseudomonadota bacterium]